MNRTEFPHSGPAQPFATGSTIGIVSPADWCFRPSREPFPEKRERHFAAVYPLRRAAGNSR